LPCIQVGKSKSGGKLTAPHLNDDICAGTPLDDRRLPAATVGGGLLLLPPKERICGVGISRSDLVMIRSIKSAVEAALQISALADPDQRREREREKRPLFAFTAFVCARCGICIALCNAGS
jgi:hypothetical protein